MYFIPSSLILPPPIHLAIHNQPSVFTFSFTATCGGRLSAAEGTFTSPGHPDRYDVDLDCEWNIVGSIGHYLTLNVQDFDLEATMNCSGDSLAIHNWNASGKCYASMIPRCCRE